MRFLMFEDFPQITDKDIEKWKTADDKQRGKMVTNIIKSYNQEELDNIRPSIRKSLYRYGIDPDKNPFIPFFDALAETNNITKDYDNLVSAMIDLAEKGDITVDSGYDYQLHPSLWERTKEDFVYTLKAFDVVSDENKLKRYFKNVDGIDISALMNEDGSIKPAGSEATSFDEGTIFGTIESWSNGGDNDRDIDDKKSKSVKLTQADLNRIRDKYHYTYVANIPKELWKEGTVVYVTFMGEHDSNKIDMADWVDSFVIYQGGKWSKYEG